MVPSPEQLEIGRHFWYMNMCSKPVPEDAERSACIWSLTIVAVREIRGRPLALSRTTLAPLTAVRTPSG